jgi:O-antigen/teichoic acid export membrane protein
VKPSRSSRTRNIFSNWTGYLVAAAINFVLSPFVVHSLGDTSYGIWILLTSLVGYLGLLDLGVRGAVTRFVAKFHAQGDHRESTKLVSSALAFFLIAGLMAATVATLLAFSVDKFFDVPAHLTATIRIVVILSGLSIVVSLIGGVYGGIVVGLQRFDYVNATEIIAGILNAIAVFVALKLGMQLLALATIHLVFNILRATVSFWLSRVTYPEVKVSLFECRRSHLSLIFSFSFSIVLLQASGMVIMFSDSVVIGALLPLSMVTFFAIAANLAQYAMAPIIGISHTLSPWASALEADDQWDQVREGLLSAARLATLVALPIVLTFMLRGASFIGLWMGPEYAELSGKVLGVLGLSLSFAAASQIVTSTMMGISRHRKLVPVFIIEAVSNIVLSVMLIPTYGIVGVAWGTAIPRLVVSLCFMPWYVRRVFGIPILKYWVNVWIKPAIAMILFALASFYIERTWPAGNLLLYFSQIAAIMPLAALGVWLVCLTPLEKQRVTAAAHELIRGLRKTPAN